MSVLLALAWGLPLFFLPQLVGGGWESFYIPRATYLVYLAALTPWWRRSTGSRRGAYWTWPEWALALVIGAQTLRAWSVWGTGNGLRWLAGLVLLRAVRGLSEKDREFLARWWWVSIPPVALYGILQVWKPEIVHIPGLLNPIIRGASTMGNPLSTAELSLLLLGQAPWWIAAFAVASPALLATRGALAASMLSLALTGKRWIALGLLPVLGATIWWRHDLSSLGVRWEIWRRTLVLIGLHPWIGTGTGTYRFTVAQGGLADAAQWIGSAHNNYLERAAEWGIPAALLFACWILARAWGSTGRTAVALAALVQFPFDHPATWALWCLTAGCIKGEYDVGYHMAPLRELRELREASSGFSTWGERISVRRL